MSNFQDLHNVLQASNKKFGAGTMRLATEQVDYSLIDTGIFPLDYALSGGLPEGQVHLFIGWEQAGKTTFAIKTIANMQNKYPDKAVVYADFEGTFDTRWAEQHGVDLERLVLIQPTTGEQGIDIMIAALSSLSCKLLVLDSVPTMISNKEAESSAVDHHMAPRAKLTGTFLNGALTVLADRRKQGDNATVIMINQFRTKIGVMFGDNRTLPGGNQQNYQVFSKVEFRMGKEHTSKDEKGFEVVTHNDHHFKIVKYKGPKSIKDGEFTMVREANHELPMGAIDDYKTVVNYAKKHGLITGGAASWNVYGIDHKFRNQDEMRAYLIENPMDYMDLKAQVISARRQELGLPAIPHDNYLIRFHGDGFVPASVDAPSQPQEDDDASAPE